MVGLSRRVDSEHEKMKSAPHPLGRRINPGAGANRPAPLYTVRKLTFGPKYNPQDREREERTPRSAERERVRTTRYIGDTLAEPY